MHYAIEETSRRRKIQEEYNKKYNITPKTIEKEIKDVFVPGYFDINKKQEIKNKKQYTKQDLKYIISELEKQMEDYAQNLDFEKAIEIRDQIEEIKRKN